MTDTDFSWLNVEKQIKIERKYDLDKNCIEYHMEAQRAFRRKVFVQNELNGFKSIQNIVAPEKALLWKKLINSNCPCLKEHDFKVSVLHDIINDEVDAEIAAHFMSEYTPIWMKFYKNDVDAELPPAAGWHIDSGPSKHLKLLLYLSDTKKINGGTSYLSKLQTQQFKNIGYVYCDFENRLESLVELANKFDITYSPVQPPMSVGDGVLFEPFRVMHRANWPTKGPRYMIQICFVPSVENWKNMLTNPNYPGETNAFPDVNTLHSPIGAQEHYDKNFVMTREHLTPIFEWLIDNPDKILEVDEAIEMLTKVRMKESKKIYRYEGGYFVQKFVTVHNANFLKESQAFKRPLRLLSPLKAMGISHTDRSPQIKVLTIGPRSEAELMGLYRLGFDPENIDAVDLLSYSPNIKIGDMHELPFEDNTYDLIILGWVLAYSSNNLLAAKEIMRVGKSDAWVAVACNGERSGVDEYREQEKLSNMHIGGVPCEKSGDSEEQSDKIIHRFWNTGQIHRLFQNRIESIVFDYNRQPDEQKSHFVELMTIFRLKDE